MTAIYYNHGHRHRHVMAVRGVHPHSIDSWKQDASWK